MEVIRTARKKSLQTQADEILQKAYERGVENNYFFVTTFEHYKTQLRLMDELQAALDDGAVIGGEINPALKAYNSTASAANQTVRTLIQIIEKLGEEKKDGGLAAVLGGMDDV